MTTSAEKSGRRYLVVMDNVVVAEDLREILSASGADGVDVRRTLDTPISTDYSAAFLSGPVDRVLGNEHVRVMSKGGTPIVLLDGPAPEDGGGRRGIETLARPFRSEDVVAVLDRLGLAEGARAI